MNLNQKLIKLFISEIKKLSVFKPVGSIKKNKLKVNYFQILEKLIKMRLKNFNNSAWRYRRCCYVLTFSKKSALKYPKAKISLTYDYNILFLKK